MKHYKEGRNHIFEFGEMSITRIKLKQSQYDELANYFTQQQVKNLNIPAVIKSVCNDCTTYPFDERGKTPLCKTCKDNPSQTVL